MWNNVQAGIIRKNIWCCVNERRIERNGVFGYKSEQFFVLGDIPAPVVILNMKKSVASGKIRASRDFGQEVNVKSLYGCLLFANTMKMSGMMDEKLKNH